VHQDIIIGLSAGIGGAIVVGLLIAVIAMALRRKSFHSKKRLKDTFTIYLCKRLLNKNVGKYSSLNEESFLNSLFS